MLDFSHFLLSIFSSPWGLLCAALWGVMWGSFANVCIYRIPKEKSIVLPHSHCPSCKQPVRFYDNIPLISWLLLAGKCRFCKSRISFQYPLVEGLSLLLSLAVYHHFFSQTSSPNWFFICRYLIYFSFSLTLLVLSVIDWQHQILPNVITYPAIPIFFLLGRILNDVSWSDAILGVVVGYLTFRLIADGYYFFTKREGLGYGDGKLLAMIGALLGVKSLLTTVLLGSVIGVVYMIPTFLLQRKKASHSQSSSETTFRHLEIPFGPFLSVGALIHLFLFTGFSMEERIFSWFIS